MLTKIISLLSFLSLFLASVPAHSAVFNISSGDVTGLIAAINAANANGEENTITLEAGTYTLTEANDGELNGLPVISSALIIRGAGAEITVIDRNASAPPFRLLFIHETGALMLEGLTLRGGDGVGVGGGLWNAGGMVTIVRTTIAGNRARFGGAGIFSGNARSITTMTNSTVVNNIVTLGDGGGIYNFGTLTITSSTLAGNSAGSFGGGIFNEAPFGLGGMLTLTNSTLAGNTVATLNAEGGGLYNDRGTVTITNSTLSDNAAPRGRTGGLANVFLGTVVLQNTILARNAVGLIDNISDCSGEVTSLGNNLIGDPTGCNISLQSTDLTGDPGLGAFVDSGAPGTGRFPLLQTSQAIDKGNNDVCLSQFSSDQLGQPRSVDGIRPRFDPPVFGPSQICDIGAVELFPSVNDLLQLPEGELVTNFDPTPRPGAPAGTFIITVTFVPRVPRPRVPVRFDFMFFEVATIALRREGAAAEDQPILLNADRGPGRVGARVTHPVTTIPYGDGIQQQFQIGLQKSEPFVFFVNVFAELVERFSF